MFKSNLWITFCLFFIFFGNVLSQKTHIIKISNDDGFKPKNVEINVGDRVIWQWEGGLHTTTSEKNKGDENWDVSLNFFTPVFEKMFNIPGEFKYYCRFHQNHKGKITVLDPVPVELTFINAELLNGHVLLLWQTATEINNLGFEIERKKLGLDWSKIAFIQGHGTTSIIQDYNFEDKDKLENSTYFYRLKQIDFDGTFSYSNEISIEVKNASSIELLQNYPNPFNPLTTINYSLDEKIFVQLRIYNSIGEEMAVLVNEIKDPGIYEIKFDGSDLSSGIYYLQMKAGNYTNIIKMMVVQ